MEEKDMNVIPEEPTNLPEEEKNPKFLKTMIIAACILAAFAVFYFAMQHFANKPEDTPVDPTPAPVTTAQTGTPDAPATTPDAPATTPTPTPASTFVPAVPEQKISFEQAMDICQKAATKHLGAGTMILPDFDGHLIEVTYDGKVRPCYVFIGGDAMSMLSSANKEPQARYVVDTTNGDVYDSISLKYIR
ncbi:MAG: hypothetical protein IKB55_03655 [Clostridia bacterium]|nr:hypothetical protein [Clostridia bacterium]